MGKKNKKTCKILFPRRKDFYSKWMKQGRQGKISLKKRRASTPVKEYWHMKKKIIYEKVSRLLFDFIIQKKYEKNMSWL